MRRTLWIHCSFVIAAVLLVLLAPSNNRAWAVGASDTLKPIGSAASGTNTVSWDSPNNQYVLQFTDGTDTIKYMISLNETNVTKGLIDIKAQLNSNSVIYPVYSGGPSYRNSSGTLMTPSALSAAASVSYTHGLASNTVTFTVTDTYQSVARTKMYTYQIQGKTLIVNVNSAATAGNNNYAGLQLERSSATTNAAIRSMAYADDQPYVMVDSTYFYSNVLDKFKSNSTGFTLQSSAFSSSSVFASTDTTYDKNTAGNVNALNETFYVTLSNDVMDTIYKTSKTASAYRNSLTDLVVLDYWQEGHGFGADNRNLFGMDLPSRIKIVDKMFNDWKMSKVLVQDHQWQRYSYDVNLPAHYPANPMLGTSTEFASYVSKVKSTYGYKISLHEDYWYMYPDATNPYWNATGQGKVAKDASGTYRNGWYLADTGVMSYAIRAEQMKYYSDLESTQINTNYDPNAAYLDVNGAWPPDNLNQISLDASAPDSKTMKDAIIGNKTLFDSVQTIYGGPLTSEGAGSSGRFDSSYAGYVDGIERKITGGANADVIVDYEVKQLRPLMANLGMGNNFFPGPTITNADWDKYRAMLIAFNHMGWMNPQSYGRPDLIGKEYYMIQPLQAQYLDTSVSVSTIEYWNGTAYRTVSQALKDGYDFKKAKIHMVYSNGLNIYVNFDSSNWTVTYNSVSYTLDQNGWVAGNTSISFLEYSCLKGGVRVDYVDTTNHTYADARGTYTTFPTFTTKGMKLVKKSTGDTTAPTIKNMKITNLTDTTVSFSWSTDESASTLADYGTTTSYGTSYVAPLDFDKNHSYTISNLSANTTYHFRVRAEDIANNGANSGDFVFKTLPAGNKASAQFTATQGTNNWYYQYLSGTSYTNLPSWDSTNSVWKHASDSNNYIGASYQHPGSASDSVRKWVAPSSGWVQVTGEPNKSSYENIWDNVIDDDGLYAYISLNNDIIWNKYIESQNQSKNRHDLTIYVTAGDVLYFRENKNGVNSYDGLSWDPWISYISKTSFTASTDYTSDMGASNWFNRSWDGTLFREMTYSGTSWSEGSASLFNNYAIPSSTRDASRSWVAKASGSIKITGTAKKKVTGGDGVIVDIFLNNQSIWNKTIAASDTTGYTHDLTIHIEAGDLVEFRVNRNITATSDDTTWDPTIAYVKPFYSVDDTTSTQGNNGWYYQKWDGSNYTNLTWNGTSSIWELASTFLAIDTINMHPENSYDAVRKWVAPNDGKVKVYGTIQRPTTGGDGVIAKTVLNSVEYWGLAIGGTDTTTKSFSYYMTVHAGDAIYFRLSKNSTIANDTTAWKIKIEYDLERYKASEDWSSVQGMHNWSYQRLNAGTYTDLPWIPLNNDWEYSTFCIISVTNMHPCSTDDTVRKWVAPFKGTIRVKGNTGVSASGGDGVVVTIKQGATTKWSRTLSAEKLPYLPDAMFAYDLTLDVNVNDPIYFILNKNSTITSDSTLLNPEIIYTAK
ncbi:fibronectin type III domain-containing protein [Paenibacillus psychroresistens]|uniref:Fibronectin type III domain-containing protein n=1 Tax=Paenibacillus psychroresistens TaxID=1778678 RepID=A0A6B8RT65_9BACL|nr:fibronectin type III domain-containing protein [Paenibacillus psychroresistens]QGQ98506.1 fibronectin type III domain-containing protein [Paenibacillus psychroresistens]